MAGQQNKVRQFTDQIYHTYLLTWPKFLMYIRMYFLINGIAILRSKKFSSGRQPFFGIMRCQQTFWLSLLYKRHFFYIIRIVEKLALPIWGWQMSILDVSFQSLVVMIEHGTSLIIEPGVMMRISWHTTPKWTRPMSRSKIQTRCHFLHSSCSEIEGFRLFSLKLNQFK